MSRWLSGPAGHFILNIGISLLVTGFVFIFTHNLLFDFPPLKSIELSLTDLRFHYRGADPDLKNRSNVVIVEISDLSFEALPAKWPWPMSYYTRLITNLNKAGAKVIGLDIIFPPGYQTDTREEEEFLAAVKKAGNVVFGGKVISELSFHRGKSDDHEVIIRTSNPKYGNRYIDTVSNFGITNILPDIDNVSRRYMPAVYDEGRERNIPTFSMAVLNANYNQPNSYTAETGKGIFNFVNKSIPRYDRKSFLINYYGPSKTFTRIGFENVLDDKDFRTTDEMDLDISINSFDDPEHGYLYDSTFAGKIVLVGSTDPAEKDLFLTPVGNPENEMMYGVEIHANVIQSVINNDFIKRQPFWMTCLIVFGLTLTTFVLSSGIKSIKSIYAAFLGIAIIVSELIIIYSASLKLFTDENFLADMTSPALAVIVSYVGSTVYNYVTERRQKILIKNMFSRYVNPTIVDELVEHPEKLTLGGERRELTVFFSDIENFTRISEKMEPEALVAVLNEYLNEMTAILLQNDGTLDKYEGDAIVAFWGAPVPQPDHAYLACRTAVQMQKSLRGFRQVWEQNGKPPLHTRIGINSGEVIVGNMGGNSRFDYTVIGDSVNLGSRLESANKYYKTNIMISESTHKRVGGKFHERELDLLIVAGKSEPIRVYELIGLVEDDLPRGKKKFLDLYATAVEQYRRRNWEDAMRKFGEALELAPDDHPSRLYIERSKLFKISPPPDEWDGSFVLPVK